MATKKDNAHSVPMHVMRDSILESDPTYRQNAADLCRRIASGKVDKSLFRPLQRHLVMSALRRAGINLRDSERMVTA